jgi:hypothetical protein
LHIFIGGTSGQLLLTDFVSREVLERRAPVDRHRQQMSHRIRHALPTDVAGRALTKLHGRPTAAYYLPSNSSSSCGRHRKDTRLRRRGCEHQTQLH